MPSPDTIPLTIGQIDLRAGEVRRDGGVLPLSEQEVALLAFFAGHPEEDISRERLLEEVLGYAASVQSRAIDDAIKRLRKKIERYPARPFHLIGVRGVGYRFVPLREAPVPQDRLLLADRSVDLGRLEVIGPDEQCMKLSALEGRLLEALAQSPGKVFSTQTLLWAVWGTRSLERRPMLTSLVHRLRTKLEDDPDDPVVLVTVRGRGIQLILPDPAMARARGGAHLRPPIVEVLGREEPLAAQRRGFDGGARRGSLLGIAGVGKSTLARQFGAEDAKNARFVDLSSVSSEGDVERAIADALGVDSPSLIAAATADWPALLLILDNAETAPEPIAAVVQRLLRSTPARLLVTSRQPLRLRQETRLLLPPLDVEPAQDLLLQRLNGLGLRDLLEEEADAIHELIEALDRIPLAIELAAARIRVLGVRGLLKRLSSALGVLRHPAPDVPERHHSLTAALSLSWDALSAAERHFLCGCSVFVSSFTLDDAEAVLGEDSQLHLETLLDASLLQVQPGDGRPRFALFAVVRRFVEQNGAAQARAALRERHIDWVISLGGGIPVGELPPLSDLPRLMPATADARAAVSAALELGDVTRAARCMLWLLPIQSYWGMPAAALALFDAIEPRLHGVAPELAWWVRYLALRARISTKQAAQLLGESRILTDQARRNRWPKFALLGLATQSTIYASEHRLDDARQCLALAESHVHDLSEPEPLRLLYTRAHVLQMSGKTDEAWQALLIALREARQRDDLWWTAYLTRALAWFCFVREQAAECETWLAEAISLLEPTGERTLLDDALGTLGALRVQQGRLKEGIDLLNDVARRLRRSGQLGNLNDTLYSLGEACTRDGRNQDARRIFADLLTSYEQGESLTRVFWVEYQLMLLDILDGDIEGAILRMESRLALFDSIDDARAEGFAWLTLTIARSLHPGTAPSVLVDTATRIRRTWLRLDASGSNLILADAMLADARCDDGAIDGLYARLHAAQTAPLERLVIVAAIGRIHWQQGRHDEARRCLSEIDAQAAVIPRFTWTWLMIERLRIAVQAT